MTSPIDVNNLQVSDFSGLRLSRDGVIQLAELARADYLADLFGRLGSRIAAGYQDMAGLLRYAQRMNQAARL